MSIIWVRHGECGDNVGVPAAALGLSELTGKGRQQAETFAAGLKEAPEVLVHSTFARSIQTAEAVLKRFPGVQVEIWPIQELTVLAETHFHNTSWKERLHAYDPYWERSHPEERHGEGAETFVEFIQRVDSAMAVALRHPARSLLLVSHGHFLRGMMWRTQNFDRNLDTVAMKDFRTFMDTMHVGHLGRWELARDPQSQRPILRNLDEITDGKHAGNEA